MWQKYVFFLKTLVGSLLYLYFCTRNDDCVWGSTKPHFYFYYILKARMIDKSVVIQLVNEWLEDKDYFLVDVSVTPDNRIVVEIDHAEGVWIEDCVELSRFIESKFDREEEDFELEVGSAGIGQPFKVLQQYINHIGMDVEVLKNDGLKLAGILKDADEEHFTVTISKKVKLEGEKRPKMVDEDVTFAYNEIKYTKYLINFK
jgi:ribosome maturation factor RimP